jgi:hypothetical protein
MMIMHEQMYDQTSFQRVIGVVRACVCARTARFHQKSQFIRVVHRIDRGKFYRNRNEVVSETEGVVRVRLNLLLVNIGVHYYIGG